MMPNGSVAAVQMSDEARKTECFSGGCLSIFNRCSQSCMIPLDLMAVSSSRPLKEKGRQVCSHADCDGRCSRRQNNCVFVLELRYGHGGLLSLLYLGLPLSPHPLSMPILLQIQHTRRLGPHVSCMDILLLYPCIKKSSPGILRI